MKIIGFNGSPREEGNTFHALNVVGSCLKEEGIDFEIIHVGNKAVRGCLACGKCSQNRDEKCSITTDPVNGWIHRMKESDGFILASPVYYSGIAGTMKCFLDRAFYVSGSNSGLYRNKVGAALVTVRRTGGSSTLDGLNHYLTYSEMIMATSHYWNVIHGRTPGEVLKDEEGVQTLQVLGWRMAWLLKMRQNTIESLLAPEPVKKVATHFIR